WERPGSADEPQGPSLPVPAGRAGPTSGPRARCAAARSRPVRLRTAPHGTSASNPATAGTRDGLRKPCDASWDSWSPPRGKEFGKKGKPDALFITQAQYQSQKSPQDRDGFPQLAQPVRSIAAATSWPPCRSVEIPFPRP